MLPSVPGMSDSTNDLDQDGRHDFDFWFGSWRQRNRKRTKPLVPGDDEWIEFESFSRAEPILNGLGNFDTYDAPEFPDRPNFKGYSLRLFEPQERQWRIWWASTAAFGHMDPPVVGSFKDGIGTFEEDDVLNGIPVRVRFTWKDITPNSATWEQHFSFDGGHTWDRNWTTWHTRVEG
jgi:hypothetical protein